MRYAALMTSNDGVLSALEEFAVAVGASQAFLFDGEGFPFLALRVPLTQSDLAALDFALDLLIDEELRRPPPFTIGAGRPAMVGAALGVENLYVVALLHRPVADETRASIVLPGFITKIVNRGSLLRAEAAEQQPHLGLLPFARREARA